MKQTARTVTVIPQTIHPLTHTALNAKIKLRVAAYARVSTDSEEQLTSYEAQVDYYTKYIKSKPEWEFAKIYTDEGITAVNTRHREGFNQMIQDALDGKIDLIVTKSISRFARNTVDCLTAIRKLKEQGINIYFEKENVYTLDVTGEVLITILSSLAQEESHSISVAVTWGWAKRLSDGKVSLAYKNFLGYEKGEDNLPKIVESEAKIVRRIYSMFMDGKTPGSIAKILTDEGIPSPAGKDRWASTTVKSILTNEKYKGAALLQKTFTVDFLTKKTKVNEGERPQYYIQHSHDAIIDPKEWDIVQLEMERRNKLGKRYSGNSVFSSKLICGDCGHFFGSKVWQSNTKYRKTIWQCNAKFKNKYQCETPHLSEEEIKRRFIIAFGKLIDNREQLLVDCRIMQDALTDTTEIDKELNSLVSEVEVVSGLMRKCIAENSIVAQNQDDYTVQYNEFAKRYDALKEKINALNETKEHRQKQHSAIDGFMFELMELEQLPIEFDEKLWTVSVESATVYRDGRVVFKFKNGAEIEG